MILDEYNSSLVNLFGADTFYRQDILVPDVLVPGRFGVKHIFH